MALVSMHSAPYDEPVAYYEFIAAGSSILYLAFWVALLGVCFYLYRHFRFSSLPWLGGYVALSVIESVVGFVLLIWHTSYRGSHQMVRVVSASYILTPIAHFLIAAMILSEVASLISRIPDQPSPPLISLLTRVHRNIPILGSVLLLLTISSSAIYLWVVIASWP
jgi:hypothetical protein